MDLHRLQRNWDELGSADPMWAILAHPERHGNAWSAEEFFATGEEWMAGYADILARLGIAPTRTERALDFGCGAGRLTRALGRRFDRVDGVDVAPSMIDLARAHHAGRPGLHFHLNPTPDLRGFPDAGVDLLVSVIVLQHMTNVLKAGYLREFVRVLRPGGVAMFTVPSHADLSPVGLLRRAPNRLQNLYRRRRYGYDAVMEFHPMRRAKVERVLLDAGANVAAVIPEDTAGPPFVSYLYVVTKPAA